MRKLCIKALLQIGFLNESALSKYTKTRHHGGLYNLVGLFGFEPKTSSMSTKRSNQLSYNPMSDECIIHDMREICKMLFAISCIWLDRCGISTLQLAILFIWIAVSPNDTADPICFIYRIRSSPCRKMTGASFPAGRAYGGQEIRIFFKSIYQDEQGKH